MSDNLSFLCGGGSRSTVQSGESQGLGERWGHRMEMTSGAGPSWGRDHGSVVASSVLQCDFQQQHHSLAECREGGYFD